MAGFWAALTSPDARASDEFPVRADTEEQATRKANELRLENQADWTLTLTPTP